MNKSFFTFLLLALFTMTLNAQTEMAPQKEVIEEEISPVEDLKNVDVSGATGPVMTFETLDLQYGEIDQNSEPVRYLDFTNTGTEPLVIKNARGSCGCTVPVWPKEPIMPGESSKIEIRYATNRLGKINKKVTLTTNEVGVEPHIIRVLGNVNKVENDEGVPASEPSMLKSGGE